MFGGGNDLLIQNLFSTPAALSNRPPPQMNSLLFGGSSSPLLEPSTSPLLNLRTNLQQQILLNSIAPNPLTQQQQLLNQLQFQLICQHPDFLDFLRQLTGAKPAPVHEVPDERSDKVHEKVTPEPISSAPSSVGSRKRTASSSPIQQLPHKKLKNMRKLHNADSETDSPVSGMHIKEASEVSADELSKACELDETASYVNVSEESRRKIASIPNVIGDSRCFLCRRKFVDVFRLAMHKCPRIFHEEYKCPDCQKVFSCPANLASHRRWHLPRNMTFSCDNCFNIFNTKKQMREHKCPHKLSASGNSITSTNLSSPTTSLTESTTDLPSFAQSPSELSTHVHSPQPALISLGLNTHSLQFADLHPHLN